LEKFRRLEGAEEGLFGLGLEKGREEGRKGGREGGCLWYRVAKKATDMSNAYTKIRQHKSKGPSKRRREGGREGGREGKVNTLGGLLFN
jgi:hypothetical protein